MTDIEDGLREAMRESFERLLRDRCDEAFVRHSMETATAHDAALWSELASLGLTGLLVPEAFGGLGGGPREAGLIMEEAGKTLLPGPLFSSAILATALIVASRDDAAKARLLPGLADGSLIATAMLTGPGGAWDGEDLDIAAVSDATGTHLSGTAHFVSDAEVADVFLVVAGRGAERTMHEVRPADGVRVEPCASFDRTQRLAAVHLDRVPSIAIDIASDAIDAALALGRVALAGRQVGAAERNFAFTIEYLGTRVQFGRQIGGFQALKHIAADLLVEMESAKTAALHAAESLADGARDAAAAVAMASFTVSDAQRLIAAESIQLHGGIGFTWEHPAHLYYRRAQHDALFLGAPDRARETFLTLLEAGQ
ncbi:acyl-CoA dehydrogenase family protein [Sphingopyxis sp.]|uniref:acyl-CoA dehydrogenase family protein n=1 Tax=Sphingopyxis sp. TaxID=1908224 RepID=UPI003D6D086A